MLLFSYHIIFFRVSCKVCGSNNTSLLRTLFNVPASAQCFLAGNELTNAHDKADLSIYICSDCTHVQAHSQLVSYYKDVITAASLSPTTLSNRLSVLKRICSLLGNNSPSICEIGSFQGDFLQYLSRHNFTNVYGIEHNPLSVQKALDLGISMYAGYLLDDDLDLSLMPTSDVLFCFNFLEHIPEPFEFLLRCKKLLKPNSYLYFTMPSLGYIQASSCLHEFVPDHVSYFTETSLSTLFRRASLTPLEINAINNGNDLEILAFYPPQDSISLDDHPYLSLISTLNSLLLDFNSRGKSVAFWGAGHRTLSLLSQLNFSMINKVVDSAHFKIGLYTPVSHLPIISPDQYRQDMTDVLILSLPGVYADEVRRIVSTWPTKPNYVFSLDDTTLTEFS